MPEVKLAADVELPEVARHHFRHRRDLLEVPLRGDGREVPDPDLRGGRDWCRACRRSTRPRTALSNARTHRRYFYFGKEPALALGTGIPWGLNARHQHSWWHFAGGEAIVNEALAKFNTIGLVCGNSGTQMGGWFRKEINTLDDLKGLKFRIGGTGGAVLAKLGVVPQQIAPGDIYPALERGTLDAVEFVGPYDDEKLGFNKVAKYYYYPGFWEGGAMLHLVVNLEAWNKLPRSTRTSCGCVRRAPTTGCWRNTTP